jgi:hypothetical protein
MRLPRWCSVVRLIGFVLLLLASCPFTAPFKPVDLATPVDGRPAGAEALLQAKSGFEDPLATLALVPVLFAPWSVTSAGVVCRERPGSSAGPLHIPLRI